MSGEILKTKLSDLKSGDKAVITRVKGHGAFRKRITEMGFVKGQSLTVIKNAPLQDPVEYELMDYKVSLRRSEAMLIETISLEDAKKINQVEFEGMLDDEILKKTLSQKGKTINIALVGNPNCGKTTLFNNASHSHERVGNYAGVTVDVKEADFKQNGYTFKIADLPGTYSLTEYSPEELYVRKYIHETMPDVVINVIDASNLERNLYLTTQLIDMDIKVVIALNMYDELEKKDAKFYYQSLARMIGIPIVPTVAAKGRGIDKLFKKIIEVYNDQDPIVRHIHINYGQNIEKEIRNIQNELKKCKTITDKLSSRYIAIKLLEEDKTTLQNLSVCENVKIIEDTAKQSITRLEKEYKDKSETIITDAKYGFIAGALKETYVAKKKKKRSKSDFIDDVLTHKIWGFPIFIFFMWLMFQTTFSLGEFPMNWIDAGVGALSEWVEQIIPPGALQSLIKDGIVAGVGGVIIFLPNILILFFFISFMEDTGYMARVSFIMDKLMHGIGLHGKSFIPLLMGFGCNVPAIMATRTLENRNDRLLSMLIIPFMSCSARLPVYVLLTAAFFPDNVGNMLFAIYLIGILLAILSALLLKKSFFKDNEAPFVMELPPYRVPTLKNTSIHMWEKAVQYLKKMGGIILIASIIIWALSYYPQDVTYSTDYDSQITMIKNDSTLTDTVQKQARIDELYLLKKGEHQAASYIGRIGKSIEPIMQPLGFDWKISVSIITGLAAKEIVVASMGVLYQAETEADENSIKLRNKLQQYEYTSGVRKGQKVITPLVAFALMLFILIYFPCIAVIAAIKNEGNWKWAIFTMIYTTGLAYLVAFLTYQIGSLVI